MFHILTQKYQLHKIVIYPEITETDKLNAKRKIEQIRADIVAKNVRFSTAAVRFSDDPGSKLQDGDLGWQSKGTMVPEFEAAAVFFRKKRTLKSF